MKIVIPLQQRSHSNFMGTRYSARFLRDELETLLITASTEEVVLDFQGISVTQSFIDELIGFLILKHSASILKPVIFKNCSPEVKAILRLVTSSRVNDYQKAHQTS